MEIPKYVKMFHTNRWIYGIVISHNRRRIKVRFDKEIIFHSFTSYEWTFTWPQEGFDRTLYGKNISNLSECTEQEYETYKIISS